jgi:sulfur-carrier protein
MPVKVELPPIPAFREAVNGQDHATAEGATVGEVLANLIKQYPALESKLFDKGQLRMHIIITVNDEDTRYLDEMETPLKERDVVVIVPSVAGGSRE